MLLSYNAERSSVCTVWLHSPQGQVGTGFLIHLYSECWLTPWPMRILVTVFRTCRKRPYPFGFLKILTWEGKSETAILVLDSCKHWSRLYMLSTRFSAVLIDGFLESWDIQDFRWSYFFPLGIFFVIVARFRMATQFGTKYGGGLLLKVVSQ